MISFEKKFFTLSSLLLFVFLLIEDALWQMIDLVSILQMFV